MAGDYWSGRATLCFAVVLVACTLGARAVAWEALKPGDRPEWKKASVLTVSGHGEVQARPDRATISLGVEGQADTARKAQDAVNAAMQAIIKQVKQLKISNRAIQTSGLNLSPVYSGPTPGQESESPRVVAYRASNII